MSIGLKIEVIAEIGVNHNGSVDIAKKLVDVAKESGADTVKLQAFNVSNLVVPGSPLAPYQANNLKSDITQDEMLKALEFDIDKHRHLFSYCNARDINFLSTPFDEESLSSLLKLGCTRIKMGSGDATNAFLLEQVARAGVSVVLSTGMSSIDEVAESTELLLCNGLDRSDLTILHCTTDYPCHPADANLNAIATLKAVFGTKVGYSDHTEGGVCALAAVGVGATVIEKHVTLSCRLPGPDHAASLEPAMFAQMVRDIRDLELAMGDGTKVPTESEVKNMIIARKSLVAKTDIQPGELFSFENVTAKRPGDGVSPMKFRSRFLGRPAERRYSVNMQIKDPDDT